MKKYFSVVSFCIFLIIFFVITRNAYSQLYSGPANGSVPNGVQVSTNNFPDYFGSDISPYVKQLRNEEDFDEMHDYPDYLNKIKPTGPEGSNKIKDKAVKDEIESNPLVLRSYQGFLDPGTYIPPDQYCAVGPNHVVGVDNGRFRIWDKNGTLLKSINANSWFSTALNQASAFDPKIQYDHFNKRWIMVWLDQSNTIPRGYFLVSVSADSIPIGTWYNYAIKSSLNGNTESNTWCDYEGVGFDNQALYLTGRMFGYGGGFQGCKFRIIPKNQLYANNAGPLNWTDLWSIKDPQNSGISPDGIRPTVIYGTPSEYYFMAHGPFTSNSYVILYKLTNPLTNPVLTGVDVPVTAYSNPPSAQQLGGGNLAIESGGQALRNEPTYRNGFLWFVHSVNSGTGYSNVRYLKINASSNTATEDVSFGADPYYHFYPSIGVDASQNLLITYSRSSPNEYIGAYYTYRLDTDPPNTLSPSRVLQAGKANYVKDFGGGRNRWGDYSGTWVDPVDQNNFWVLSQYAETPANTWASWMANIRLVPFSGARIYTLNDTLNFGNKEVNINNTDTMSVKLFNYGSSVLTISGIVPSSANFRLAVIPNFPINVNYQDSIILKVLCKPIVTGQLIDTLRISSNDPTAPVKGIYLKCKGFVITPVASGVLYGVTGIQESGSLITVNTTNGNGTTVGPTGFSQLTGLSIRKSNGQLYGTTSGLNITSIVRVNSAAGDAYLKTVFPVGNTRGIAWDINDDLYLCGLDGSLYKFNINTNDTVLVGNTGVSSIYGITINPLTGTLWGVTLSGSLYKINKQNAAATQVGSNMGIGFTAGLTFDMQGKLFISNGQGAQISSLYTVDTITAIATLIGSTGKKGINGLAISPNPIGIEPISTVIPDKFELYQNYPNPFNPETKIKFDIAKQTFVKISIYDVTGRLVTTLVEQNMVPGRYIAGWNAGNYPSGVYFYHIEAGDFNLSKKMILVK